MRNPGRQPAQRRHFFGLIQLGLGILQLFPDRQPFPDIIVNPHGRGFGIIPFINDGARHFHGNRLSPGRQNVDLGHRKFSPPPEIVIPKFFHDFPGHALWIQSGNADTPGILEVVAEQFLGSLIHQQNTP